MNVKDFVTGTTAAEVMSPEVVTLQASQSVSQAVETLFREQVSGAPVVNEEGCCCGVFSVSDIAGAQRKMARERQHLAQSSFWSSSLILPVEIYEEKLSEIRETLIPNAEQPVERWMTSDPVTVLESTRLERILQNMIDAHIHRVIVTNEQQQIRGIISTTDILAALLRASHS